MKSNKERIIECLHIYEESFTAEEVQGASTQYLSNKLSIQRSNISAILNMLVKDGSVVKVNGRPVLYRLAKEKDHETTSCFKKLIGNESSLKRAVQLAKAAVLYPSHSLHSLIIGARGTGKTCFASTMYEFAKETKIIKEDASFVKFNCLTYANDDTSMADLLFQNANCAIKQAQHGVLFIDHVECLSQDATEMLFHILDNEMMVLGKPMYTIVICALDDTTGSKQKEIFLGKFSILIQLPLLQDRSLQERMELIHYFFSLESMQTKRKIKIESSSMQSLLLYESTGNVKQLKKDIQIACANAYVREFQHQQDELPILESDFPIYIKKGSLNYRKRRTEVNSFIADDCYYIYSDRKIDQLEQQNQEKVKHKSIYDMIVQKSEELRNRGIEEYDINFLISVDIENEFNEYTKKLSSSIINKDHLRKVVDNEIISTVDDFLKEASQRFHSVYPISVFYGLCLHLSNSLKNPRKVQQLSNERIMDMVEKHKEEYAFCTKFVSRLEKQFSLSLPIDEVIFITMFLCEDHTEVEHKSSVQVVLAMHGKGNASTMADVVNDLVKAENVYPFDLLLDKDMKEAYDELKQLVLDVDQGLGILYLYDMGSLRTMAEMIQQECNVRMQLIELPATLIAMDCARKAASNLELDAIYHQIVETNAYPTTNPKQTYQRYYDKQIIITLCMSGKGGAYQMKHYIEKYLDFEDIDILPFAISDREYLLTEVNRLQKESHILCVIGTYDPQLFDVPFVSITQLYETPLENLRKLLISQKQKITYKDVNYDELYAFLKEQMEDDFVDNIREHLPNVMDTLCKDIPEIGIDQRLGLFLHLSCSMYGLCHGERTLENKQKKTVIQRNKKMYTRLKAIFSPLEKAFGIQFNDDEISYVITSIKKL